MPKNEAVFGIYPDRARLESAVTALKHAGFSNSDVAILAPQSYSQPGHSAIATSGTTGVNTTSTGTLTTEKSTKAPEGATTGAGSGFLLGGALGWFVGVGALAIPGLGPLIAAGPILAALAGAGVGGAVGGVTGGLIGMGIPEFEAKKYEGRIAEGGTLLSVHCDTAEERDRAKQILESTGAEDISSSTEIKHHKATTEETEKSRAAKRGN